ncbi:MAG: hypothetical protein M1836_003089 [Candelina mexicana]|nr:MAG: hypothetical protein M1836_003089 [Candelina mexicana]
MNRPQTRSMRGRLLSGNDLPPIRRRSTKLNDRDTRSVPDRPHSEDHLPTIRRQKAAQIPIQPFRLLDLPIELRLQIYGYVLDPPIIAYPVRSGPPGERLSIHRRPDRGTALLRANHQIHDEATPLIYRTPEFRFSDGPNLCGWLDSRHGKLSTIRNVKVFLIWEVPAYPNPFIHGDWVQTLQLLNQECPNLQRLTLEWNDIGGKSLNPTSRQLLADMLLESGIRNLRELTLRIYTLVIGMNGDTRSAQLARTDDLRRRLAPMLRVSRDDSTAVLMVL